MSTSTQKRCRKIIDSPSMLLRSTQSRQNTTFSRTRGQQEYHQRTSTRNHPAIALNGTSLAPAKDILTDPAGFLSNDHNTSQDNILSLGVSDSHLLDKDPTIEKISIGVDFGTVNSSVAYKLHWKGQNLQPRPGKDEIIREIKTVKFPNSPYVKTQIGWHSETHKMLCGYEVDVAIRRGKLLRGSHIQDIKLTLLDPSGQTRAERYRVEKQINALPHEIRLIKNNSGSFRNITPEDLVSEFIGFLIRHCLQQICSATGHEQIPWLRWGMETAFRDIDPVVVAKVAVYIAVPSLSTAEFVDLIIAAAQTAGLSDVVVAPEPACAQQLLLQRDFEEKREREGNPYSGASIILDVGGGTADLQTLSIVKYDPMEIMEEVLGDGDFLGGRYVNSLFRDLAKRKIGNQEEWLLSQLCYPGYKVTMDEVLDHLEAEFEKAKTSWYDPTDRLESEDLLLPGRPYNLNRPDRGLVGNAFRLSRHEIIEIFTTQAQKLIGLIDNQIHRFQGRIRRILLVGGCSCCALLRTFLHDHYAINQAATYKIEVLAPEPDTTFTIATGVLLAGFDENFISSRYLRRSYGIAWERAVEQLKHRKTPHHAKLCPYDKAHIAQDMSKFLLKSGQRVKRQFSSALSDDYGTREGGRAWRAIPRKFKHDKVKLTERIIYSDHVNDDDLWIWDKSHKMRTIEIRLNRDEWQVFDIRQNPKDGNEYYYLEYEVILRGDGLRMTYEFLIPRTGKFEDAADDKDCIRKTATLNLASAFAFYTEPSALL